MTVKELITELENFNPDMKVLVSGYEYGFSEPQMPKVVLAYYAPDSEIFWWAGDYRQSKTRGTEVVVIER